VITTDEFCDLLTSVKGHLLTEKVRNVLKDFVHETEGGVVTYAYSTAFQNLLTDIETAKKVYLQVSGGSKTREVSKDDYLRCGMSMSKLNPLQVDILFALSDRLHNSKTLIYSDLQSLAPEQYMK